MNQTCAIVFVHGIVGNNKIFDFLQPLVSATCEVKSVVLKGHGGDALAFSRASMAEWKAQVEEAVTEMSGRHERIIGVGHSMGCLLLMDQAVRIRLAGLFLLNPPMRVKPHFALLINALKVAIGYTKRDPVAQAAKEAYGISIDFNPLHYYGWPERYIELFLEIRRIRKEVLSRIECPIVAFLSDNDEMVSLSSEKELGKLSNSTTIRLRASTHYYYSAADREKICQEFRAFCNHSCNRPQRLNLHAHRVEFTFPIDGNVYSFESPVPF